MLVNLSGLSERPLSKLLILSSVHEEQNSKDYKL